MRTRFQQRLLHATSAGAYAALLTSLAFSAVSAQNRTSRPATAALAVITAEREIDTLALRSHTRFLSDDLLRGRGTGTEGERVAAAYIESQLIELGLRGIGSDGAYRLPVPLRSAQISPSSTMFIARGADSVQIHYGARGFIVNTGGAASFRDFNGPVIYAGPAASALPLLRSSTQLRGAVIAFNGAMGAAAVDIVPLLMERGAAGIIVLVNDPAQYALYVRSRGESRYFADAHVNDPVWQPDIPVIIGGPAVIAQLVAGDADALGRADAGLVQLHSTLSVHIAAQFTDVAAANVGGIVNGTDPRRTNDLLVFTAHYDHLGISDPDERGDTIYNGFSDNAAGCAMLLAIAKSFAAHPAPYSVAFLFFTGEERGLLGSSYMASAPPFDLKRVRALVNLDAGAPPRPPVSWRLAGGTEVPRLGTLAQSIATKAGWTTSVSAASPNSDYWPFLRLGVPAVFIIPGAQWENTSEAEHTALVAKWDHYHQAADEWSPLFPFSGLRRYAAYALALGRAAMTP